MLTGKPTVNGGAEQLRWPEMLVDDAEEAGTRGRHGRTQRVAANSGVVSALAGELPGDGASLLLLLGLRRTRARSMRLLCCAQLPYMDSVRCAGSRGFEWSAKGRRGLTEMAENRRTRRRNGGTPSRNFLSLEARWTRDSKGK